MLLFQYLAFMQFTCWISWWRHRMETFSALLAICAGNSPGSPGEFPALRPMTRSFDVFFDLHPNKRLSKQWWGWWFETPLCPLWRHRNVSKSHLLYMYWLMPCYIPCWYEGPSNPKAACKFYEIFSMTLKPFATSNQFAHICWCASTHKYHLPGYKADQERWYSSFDIEPIGSSIAVELFS